MLKGFRVLLDEANAEIETLPVEMAIAQHGDQSVIFVDLRDPRELEREGMIAGAFHCPRGMLEFWIDPESPYHKPIFAEPKKFVFTAPVGGGPRCKDMGLQRVAHVMAGFRPGSRPVDRSRKRAPRNCKSAVYGSFRMGGHFDAMNRPPNDIPAQTKPAGSLLRNAR